MRLKHMATNSIETFPDNRHVEELTVAVIEDATEIDPRQCVMVKDQRDGGRLVETPIILDVVATELAQLTRPLRTLTAIDARRLATALLAGVEYAERLGRIHIFRDKNPVTIDVQSLEALLEREKTGTLTDTDTVALRMIRGGR